MMADKVLVQPDTDGKYPLAPKVKWASAWATLAPILVTWAVGILSNGDIVTGVPDWLTGIVLGALAGGGTLVTGRAAPHQDRVTDTPAGGYPSGGTIG